MKKIWCLLLSFIFVLSGCSCNNVSKTTIFSSYIKAYLNKESNDYKLVEPFNTYISVSGYDEDRVKGVESKFNELVYKYHSLFDSNYYYKDNNGNYINNIKVINDSYGDNNGVVVDPVIIDILKEGIKYTKLSNGKFNIFSGAIVDEWKDRFDPLSSLYKVDVSEEDINEAMNCVLSVNQIDEYFVIDEENNKVVFKSLEGCVGKVSITLGALAKSYFLDQLVEEKVFKDVGSSIYDAGQSSIVIVGDNPLRDNKEWNIGISDSLNEGNALQLSLRGSNKLSTSSYKNNGYVKEDGTIRHHIIDCNSGYPSNYVLSTTVIGDSAMIMDIVSTTIMTMNLEEIKSYLLLLNDMNVKVDVLLQIKEDTKLKILVNESMKDKIKEVYNGVSVEVLDYGA